MSLTPAENTLSPVDQSTLLNGLRELYGEHDLTAFPRTALRLIQRLVPCLFASYNEMNLRTGGVVIMFEPEEVSARMAPTLSGIFRYQQQHPLFMEYQNSGASEALRISDFVPWEEWIERPIYREVMGPVGVGESMSFTVNSTTYTRIFFVLNRERPDFSERDVAICNLLRPHLQQAFENAQAFTEARALGALATNALGELSHGLVITERSGWVRHANELAVNLVSRYFPGPPLQPWVLPPVIIRWMKECLEQPAKVHKPFRLAEDTRTLVVRMAERNEGCLLLLEERGPEPDARRLEILGLTPREAEVLYWITQGKSNAEAATILGISTRTVDKHVENIYAKLGVEARGAAMSIAAERLSGAA